VRLPVGSGELGIPPSGEGVSLIVTRSTTTCLARSAAFCWLLFSLLSPAYGAAPDAKPSASRLIPSHGLVAYAEFDGLDSHAEAWKATSAHAMLSGTSAGAMMTELARQVTDRLLKELPGVEFTGADVLVLHDHLTRQGFTLGVYAHENKRSSSILVLRDAGRKGVRERFERLLRLLIDPKGGTKLPAPIRLRDRDIFQLIEKSGAVTAPDLPHQPPKTAKENKATAWLTWWSEGDDLVFVTGPFGESAEVIGEIKENRPPEMHKDRIEAVIDTIEGKQPDAATHPDYAVALAEGRDIQGFESAGLFFFAPDKNTWLFTSLLEAIGVLDRPYRGLSLPSVPYINDDVRFFDQEAPPHPPASGKRRVAPFAPPPPGAPATPASLTNFSPAPADNAQQKDGSPPIVPGLSKNGRVEKLISLPGGLPDGVSKRIEHDAAPLDALTKAELPPVPGRSDAEKKTADLQQVIGFDGISRVVGRWGFQGKSLLTDVRVETPAPRAGLLGLLDQPVFDKRRLPPIPRGVRAFFVGAFDPSKSYPILMGLMKASVPEVSDQFVRIEEVVRDRTGLRLREDLLDHLGPTWSAFTLPSMKREGGSRKVDLTGYAIMSGVDDAGSFGKALDTVASRFNEYLRKLEGGDGGEDPSRKNVDPPVLAMEPLKAPDRGYQLTSPAGLIPWFGGEFRPTVLIGRSCVVFASNPDRAREALAGELDPGGRWEPTGEVAKAFDCLPDNLTFLSVGDPNDGDYPEAIVNLPAMVQTLSTAVGDLRDPDAPSATNLRTLLGVPRPGGFRVRIAPELVPKEDDLKAQIFPSVLALTVDERGIRLIGREAVPLACLGETISVKSLMTWTPRAGFRRDIKFKLKFGFGD